jgi:hypothetical protein
MGIERRNTVKTPWIQRTFDRRFIVTVLGQLLLFVLAIVKGLDVVEALVVVTLGLACVNGAERGIKAFVRKKS